jgi:hypothetical protein
MTGTVTIYGLYDPRDGQLRYVGKTRYALSKRLREHCGGRELSRRSHKVNWLRCLLAAGLRPEIRAIEETTEKDWQERESHWVRHYRETGAALTNATEDGSAKTPEKYRPSPRQLATLELLAFKRGHTPHNKVTFDDAALIESYVQQGKSAQAIADALGLGEKAVLRRLSELGVTRNVRSSAKLRPYGGVKGRGAKPELRKEQCKHGHAFTDANTYFDPRGCE